MPGGSMAKPLPASAKGVGPIPQTRPNSECPLEEEMATHSSVPA